jgi:Flp pilus assembly protein TadG
MRRPDQCLDRAPPPLGRKRRPKAGSPAAIAEAAMTAVAIAAKSTTDISKKHARSVSPTPSTSMVATATTTIGGGEKTSRALVAISGNEQNGFDVADANELMAFREWQRKRQRRNMDEWQAALAGVDTSLYDQPRSMHASVPTLPLRHYDETRYSLT